MASSQQDRYDARLRSVLEYIDTHLDEPLDLACLSAVAAFSKFHFHRQFAERFGISVSKYVQLTRFKRASYRLAFREKATVLDIAHASGYEGPEAFARAYKKAIGQSPIAFRTNPKWDSWYATFDSINALRSEHMSNTFSTSDVQIVDFPTTQVAALEHRGDPRCLGNSIRTFIEWRKRSGLNPRVSATYNILYDDPSTVSPNEYRFDLCAATNDDVPPNEFGIVNKEMPGGRCARLRVTGGDAAMAQGIRFLYSRWLPSSGSGAARLPIVLAARSLLPGRARARAGARSLLTPRSLNR